MGDYIMRINGQTVKNARLGGVAIKEIRNTTTQVVLWRKPAPNYFYFEDRSGAANNISIAKTGDQAEWLSLEYSTDKETWNTWDFSQSISLAANGKVYLRGNNTKFSVSSGNYHNFSSTGNAYAGGSVRSLFNKNVPQIIDSSATMFGFMFNGMTTLVGVDTNLFAGINYGSSGSWRDTTNMFYKTFSSCSSLVTPPDLSGLGYVRDGTFRETFSNCDLLESAAPMNVTEIDTSTINQFRSMYYHCFALMDASPLRIGFSTAVQYTFYQMFPDDRILATAPDLTSITTLGNQSMRLMLYNCKPLDVVKIGISAWGDFEDSTAADYNATYQWLAGVHSTGVFCKNSTLPVMRGANYIPNNWSIADLNGKLYAPVITNTNNTITIAEAEGGASCQIWYTTDGTTPTPQNGTLYTQPFNVASGTTVKAIVHYNGNRADLITDSDVAWAESMPEPTLTIYSTAHGQGSETTCNQQPLHKWTIRMKTTGVEGVTYYLNWENTDTLEVYPIDPTTSTYDATATYSGQIGCVEADSECMYTVTICDADMLGDAVNFSVIGVRNGFVSNPSYLSICNGECEEPETDCTDCTNWQACGFESYEDCQCQVNGIDCPAPCVDWENKGYESYEECDCAENGNCGDEPDCTDCNNWEECGYGSYEDCDCQVNGNCEEEPED